MLPGGQLASGCEDGTLQIWQLSSCECVATLAGHKERVSSLAALEGGQLASASFDGTINIWQVATAACVATLKYSHGKPCFIAAFGLGRLASGRVYNGEIKLWSAGLRGSF